MQDSKFNLNRITPFDSSTAALYYTLSSNKISNLVYGSAYKYPVSDTKGNITNDGTGGTFTYNLASKINLVAVPNALDKGVHEVLAKEEFYWGIYHSPIMTGLKSERNVVNGICNCR